MKFNAKSITILVIMVCLTACLCGCGGGNSDEETVSITTVDEEAAAAAEEAENMSEYEAIYNEYNKKMKEATEKYIKEVEAEADNMDKDDLYDLVNEKVDALGEIKDKGASKMTDKTLNSTEDDQKEYEKWFSKLSETYTDYTREITSIYTEQFD